MLDALRRGSKSWIAKSLLVLLVLSFGIWGVADYLVTGREQQPAIRVGDQSFSAEFVREQFNEEVTRLRRQGVDLRPEQALAFGVMDRAVRTVVQGAVLDESVRALKLTVTDQALSALIAADKDFQDAQGRFDRERLNRLLQSNGLTETRYVELRRREMLREALIGPVMEGGALPAIATDTLARHISERRRATVVTVPASALPEPPATPADPAVLDKVHAEAQSRFMVPETRTVTWVTLTPAAVLDEITVSQEAIREFYETHVDQYTQPATRTVTQGLFPSEAAARDALAEIRQGKTLTAATQAHTGRPAVTLPAVTPDGLPAPLGATVFAQAVGVVGEPVEGPFGWHLFLVTADTPAGVRPLEAVNDEIRKSLAEEQAQDALYALSTRLEDALASGTPLPEAATQIGLTPRSLSLTRDGKTADGQPVPDLPRERDFLGTLFSLESGQSTPVTETGQGYVVARVDAVAPAHPQPLDAVRTEVVALWRDAERRRAAETLADDLLTRARAGGSLESMAAQTPGLGVRTVGPLTRAGQTGLGPNAQPPAEPVDPAVVDALFATAPGALARVSLADGAAVLRVDAAEAPPADVALQEKEALAAALRQSVADDLVSAYTDALAVKVGVSINQSVIRDAVQPNR